MDWLLGKKSVWHDKSTIFSLSLFNSHFVNFSKLIAFILPPADLLKVIIWASSWDYGTSHIGNQRRLRRACASEQSCQSLCCSHTWSMEVDKGSDKKNHTSSSSGWLRMRVWRTSLRRTKSAIISWDGWFSQCLQWFHNEWEHYRFSPLHNMSVLCKLNNIVVTIWWVPNIKYTCTGSLKLFIG